MRWWLLAKLASTIAPFRPSLAIAPFVPSFHRSTRSLESPGSSPATPIVSPNARPCPERSPATTVAIPALRIAFSEATEVGTTPFTDVRT